jgi:hypothetical protein
VWDETLVQMNEYDLLDVLERFAARPQGGRGHAGAPRQVRDGGAVGTQVTIRRLIPHRASREQSVVHRRSTASE